MNKRNNVNVNYLKIHIKQGWPTGRSPRLSWSIAPDFALNWRNTWKEHIFQSIFLFIAFYDVFYLWLYYRPVDRKLTRNFVVDPSRRQFGHPWYRVSRTALSWATCSPRVWNPWHRASYTYLPESVWQTSYTNMFSHVHAFTRYQVIFWVVLHFMRRYNRQQNQTQRERRKKLSKKQTQTNKYKPRFLDNASFHFRPSRAQQHSHT